ncbi:luciferase-like monooxygenase family protein [Mycobacterium xenopi 3993]|nr:luciferase-like monooxygenase family protein [Mycobacterium xenopi 3993]
MAKLRFGYFMAPFHRAGTNPTLALQRDLEFVEHIDALGFDEVWFGEHHSAGSEIISSPEIFIAAAAQRTKRIRLGTGLSRSPTTTRCGLPIGWCCSTTSRTGGCSAGGTGLVTHRFRDDRTDPTDTRELLETNLDILVRLLAGETVTAKTATHELFDARLQLAPYSEGGIPLAVAAVASPTGARLAGKHGIGLLSIGRP